MFVGPLYKDIASQSEPALVLVLDEAGVWERGKAEAAVRDDRTAEPEAGSPFSLSKWLGGDRRHPCAMRRRTRKAEVRQEGEERSESRRALVSRAPCNPLALLEIKARFLSFPSTTTISTCFSAANLPLPLHRSTQRRWCFVRLVSNGTRPQIPPPPRLPPLRLLLPRVTTKAAPTPRLL